jgi:hypothetical protein
MGLIEGESMTDIDLEAAFSLPSGFRIREVSDHTEPRAVAASAPSLGPLAAFTGTFKGHGFNTIFRPDSLASPTPLPITVPPPPPPRTNDNVLELNLTHETLSFSPSLGSIPNRGSGNQPDAFLNGVPYLQTIQDVTIPSQPVGIHFEPGIWLAVPPTTNPAEGATVARMASIPHGTTIEAQGTSFTIAGKPDIGAVDITPFVINSSPVHKIPFPSQTATDDKTLRIPQNLAPFIAAGTITQAMLDDPNTLLRNHIASQNITSTTVILISSNPASPLFGGGTDNIAFLLGDPAASDPNADAVKMDAQFWIETVEYTLEVPVFEPGQPPLVIPAPTGAEGQPVPKFLVNPPVSITEPRYITVRAPQIQYSQQVFLNFKGLTWPHVSVATLVPRKPIPVPPTVWTAPPAAAPTTP